jgi:AcrR family transcriptional regulator
MGLVQLLIDSGHITDPASPRGRLLDCAADLFSEKGFERTTVRDIAHAVGIQSGSIFHHFKTKEEILKALMTEAVLCFTEKLKAAVDEASSPEEKVLACIKSELQFTIGDDTVAAMSVLVSEWRCLSANSQQEILVLREAYEQVWMEALNSAKAAGLIKANAFVVRRLVAGAINWSPNWYHSDGTLSRDDLAAEVFGVICSAGDKS